MDKPFRRYEMLLPLRFNDGQPVPNELIADTILELEERFGAVSCDSQVTRGYWRHEGETYRDELVRVYLDVPASAENRDFFAQFKELLNAQVKIPANRHLDDDLSA